MVSIHSPKEKKISLWYRHLVQKEKKNKVAQWYQHLLQN